ncbi:hypothetical protein [Capnocytophaga sputigena]|uniref:hypothetical protein n=1 Tax=Capnocytophaga sputigena TaxID=1019 RepID=UPI00241F063D
MDKLVATFTLDETGQTVTAELWHTVPTSKCLIEFRPPEKFDWSFGFDWFREGKEGDNGINFAIDCSTAAALRFNEYKAKEIDFSQWKNPPRDKKYLCDSWLAIYPPNKENYGATEATVRLLAYCDKDFHEPLKVEFNSEYFEVTPATLTLPKTTNNRKGTFLKESLNIKCIAPFSKEQTIRILSEQGEEVGCLRVVPNDDDHRYKLKIILVNVALVKGDKEALGKIIRNTKIEELLVEGPLKHCFLRPIIEPMVQELDLTAESAQWESYRKEIPQEGTGILEKVIDPNYLKEVHRKIKLTYNDKTNVEYDKSIKIVFYFINHKVASFKETIVSHTEKKREWEHTYGYTDTPGINSLIMQDGVNVHTLCHEALHARILHHTFSDNANRSKYLFTKYRTDNVMDYGKKKADEENLKSTYKWQWDTVKEFANQDNTYHKLPKESD